MTVKGNQPSLQKEVIYKCRPLLTGAAHDVVEERGHGRINRWSCWITDATGIVFPHASQVACVRRDVLDFSCARLSKEFAFVITSSPSDQTAWTAPCSR